MSSRNDYIKHNRLGRLLDLGMVPEQVEEIMGKASSVVTNDIGFVWRYYPERSSGGDSLQVTFRYVGLLDGTQPEVCSVSQDSDVRQMAPNPQHYEFKSTKND